MKLVSFETTKGPGFGLVQGEQVADLTGAFAGRASSLRGLLAAGCIFGLIIGVLAVINGVYAVDSEGGIGHL